MTLSAPFFRALVVSAAKFTWMEEPATSSKQRGAVRGSFLSQHLSLKAPPFKKRRTGHPKFNCKVRATRREDKDRLEFGSGKGENGIRESAPLNGARVRRPKFKIGQGLAHSQGHL